jgi:hypothetical protein
MLDDYFVTYFVAKYPEALCRSASSQSLRMFSQAQGLASLDRLGQEPLAWLK